MTNSSKKPSPIGASGSLFFSTEFAGALLSKQCSLSAQLNKDVSDNIKGTLFSLYNIDLADISVKLVKNSHRQVALVLPYYSLLEDISAGVIKDNDINHINGGEIFVSIGTAIFVLVSAAGATISSAAAGAIGVGAVVGGSVAVAVAAGGVAAGIGAGVHAATK